jgi:Zn-dependent protease with chaperone function
MDFFEAQDRAKRNTGKLVVLYVLAVIGIILSVYVVTLLLFHSQVNGFAGASFWYPGWLLTVSLIILLVIAAGTAFRVSQLRKGGSAVAELLGGRRVESSTTDLAERRLMNVVEEMSIASGLPVPDVYILDNEENINAFAAGFGTNDAAVGVTKGTLDQLTRDELQGVIAHEFSHIFNGDMRLNIRLIGILNGILVIHIMGMILMRSVMYSGGMRVRSSNSGKGGGNSTIAIIAFGLSLVVIGYVGMIFGRMIQSAISRQREYLADAAAVQYTRNPDGLAGALNKIGLKKKGAEIKDGHAMEMSHLFFASSFHSALDMLFSTHPPLEKRIKAISPSYGSGKEERFQKKIRKQFDRSHVAGKDADGGESSGVGGHPALTPEVILAAIGTLGAGGMKQANNILKQIPDSLKNAAHEPLGAEALIYSLLLSSGEQKKIPEWLLNTTGSELSAETDKLLSALGEADRKWFLPLAELAMPSLRKMSTGQYKDFRSALKELLQRDESENLFGFALEKMVIRRLDAAFSDRKEPAIRHHNLKEIGNELSVLLSALSYISDDHPEKAWSAALKPIEKVKPDDMELLPREKCSLPELDGALDELAASANPVKKYIISAVIYCVISDKIISAEEMELLRAVSEALDTPVPAGLEI